jgi:hypothetical protein
MSTMIVANDWAKVLLLHAAAPLRISLSITTGLRLKANGTAATAPLLSSCGELASLMALENLYQKYFEMFQKLF